MRVRGLWPPAGWTLRRDRPNLLRVRFPENGGRKGTVAFAEEVEATPILRECAISYAITETGRPVGDGEEAPKGERIIRHDAAPYAFALDGKTLSPTCWRSPSDCASAGCGARSPAPLPAPFAPLYRAAAPRRFAPGPHTFEIVSGESDVNYFLPALWLAGEFRVFGETIFTETEAPAPLGSFAALGYPHYAGALTWRATVAVPGGVGWRLRADTGSAVATARLCGVELGARAWEPFEWEVPESLAGTEGELEITVVSTVQPLFGPHEVEGKTWDTDAWDRLRTPGADCGLFSVAWVWN